MVCGIPEFSEKVNHGQCCTANHERTYFKELILDCRQNAMLT
jgi:hypothetical protein